MGSLKFWSDQNLAQKNLNSLILEMAEPAISPLKIVFEWIHFEAFTEFFFLIIFFSLIVCGYGGGAVVLLNSFSC